MNLILSQIGTGALAILALYIIIKIFDYFYTKDLEKTSCKEMEHDDLL